MIENYKVYFQNRFVVFKSTIPENPEQKYGLFYKYHGRKKLYQIIREFEKDVTIPSLLIVHPDLRKLWKKFRRYFKYIKAGGGYVQNEFGEFLAIKRRGTWDLPKGKKNKRESLKDTALREVAEETGLKSLQIVSYLHTTYHSYPLKGCTALKKTKWYLMSSNTSEKFIPEKKEKISEVKWISPENVEMILEDTFPSVVDVIEEGLKT